MRMSLHRNQHTYESGKSCESEFHWLAAKTGGVYNDKEIASEVFLDTDGASVETFHNSQAWRLRPYMSLDEENTA